MADMNGSIEVRVPDIGDFNNVPVVDIFVSVGQMIAVDDTVIALESDKATLDVPSPVAGRVVSLSVAKGDKLSRGSVVLLLEPAERAVATLQPAAPSNGSAPASAMPSEPIRNVAGAAAPEPPLTSDDGGRLTHASPSVRKFARELGVDAALVTGTGPKGRITREDVQVFVKRQLSTPAVPASAAGLDLPPWPKVDYAKFGPVTREPLSRIKRISGPSLARNAMFIPHVTSFEDSDITDLEAFRSQVNAASDGGKKLSILPFVVKAAVAALKAFPAFNSSLDGDDLVLKQYYNIGVAADTPDGLVVPVIKDADRKGLKDIAAEMAALAADARQGKLKSKDIQGATFTISSLGGVGGTNFTPIINAPEVAILGLVRSAMKPVWDGKGFQPRLIQPLSLSWDHRVVDGVAAARFLVFLKDILADFRRISL
jgi:pyruvate dehydrogenase E2 component (dihydrolipoamide acetyltransferase)